jgi:predicted nucleic acid-binding protein
MPKDRPAVCRDPRNEYLVALATASGAEAVVTGDLDLLKIDEDQLSIEILTPRQLTSRLS